MRATVILHERLGNWNRQLRPRLHQHPVRWFESRSPADLEGFLEGLACPVILIDLGGSPSMASRRSASWPRGHPMRCRWSSTPEARSERRGLARELGATYIGSGYVPPAVCRRVTRPLDHRRPVPDRDRRLVANDPPRYCRGLLELAGRVPRRAGRSDADPPGPAATGPADPREMIAMPWDEPCPHCHRTVADWFVEWYLLAQQQEIASSHWPQIVLGVTSLSWSEA